MKNKEKERQRALARSRRNGGRSIRVRNGHGKIKRIR